MKAFISYSHKDEQYLERLKEEKNAHPSHYHFNDGDLSVSFSENRQGGNIGFALAFDEYHLYWQRRDVFMRNN